MLSTLTPTAMPTNYFLIRARRTRFDAGAMIPNAFGDLRGVHGVQVLPSRVDLSGTLHATHYQRWYYCATEEGYQR